MTYQAPHTFKNSPLHINSVKFALTALLSAGLLACGDSGGGDSEDPTYGEASVIVDFLNDDGEAQKRSGALFAFSAALRDTTNSAGYARITQVPTGDRQLLNVIDDESFAPQLLAVDIQEGDNLSHLDARLLKLYAPTDTQDNSYTPSQGGSFDARGGGQVTLPQNAVKNTSDDRVWRINLAGIDVNDERLLPADMRLKLEDDSTRALEAFGGLYVGLRGSSKTNLTSVVDAELKDDATVTVRLPALAGSPATSNLYVFDFSTGYWQSESELNLDAATNTYVGQTSRLGYLAAMRPVSNTVSITGCVNDATGKPLARAEIKAFGTSYAGFAQTRTDATGKFSLPVKAGASLSVQAKRGQYKTETEVNTAQSTQVNGSDCMVVDTSSTAAQVSGKASWNNTPARDFDVNIILPNGDILFYNKRSVLGGSGEALRITENVASGTQASEDIRYNSLMKGLHFIAINRYFDQSDSGITAAQAQLTLNGQTFTPPSGEVAVRRSALSDERTHVWLAAVMEVDDECNVSIKTPSEVSTFDSSGNVADKKLADWMTNDQFVNLNLYKDGTLYEAADTDANYC